MFIEVLDEMLENDENDMMQHLKKYHQICADFWKWTETFFFEKEKTCNKK